LLHQATPAWTSTVRRSTKVSKHSNQVYVLVGIVNKVGLPAKNNLITASTTAYYALLPLLLLLLLLLLLFNDWLQHIPTSQQLHPCVMAWLAAAAAQQHMLHPPTTTTTTTLTATFVAAAAAAAASP
jgi:hypothetical protein